MHQIPGLYVISNEKKGRGVFTSTEIVEGSIIEVCHVIVVPNHEVHVIHKTILHDYYFVWGDDMDACAIALGYGSLYNHQVNPNAYFVLDLDNHTIDIIALRDIAIGEEITINYHGEEGDEERLWFDPAP